MRGARVLGGAALLLAAAVAAEESQALTAQQLEDLLERREPVVVIDVRSPRDYARGHIPGALNIPAQILPGKPLPPLGRVVVCGDGVGSADLEGAVRALNAKPGLAAEALEGGMPAWQSLARPDTRAAGVEPETIRYLTYQELEALAGDPQVALVDLREGKVAPPTDLRAAFPAIGSRRVVRPGGGDDLRSLIATGRSAERLLVIIDGGDGRAEAFARRLQSAGVVRLAILAGGERSLVTRGRPGRRTVESNGGRW